MSQSHVQLRLSQDRDQHSHFCYVHVFIASEAPPTWWSNPGIPFLNYEFTEVNKEK